MQKNMIYLIKPTSVWEQGHDYNLLEKPQLGVYIAKNIEELKRIESNLRSHGYRDIKIEEVRFDSLRYVPWLFRQLA